MARRKLMSAYVLRLERIRVNWHRTRIGNRGEENVIKAEFGGKRHVLATRAAYGQDWRDRVLAATGLIREVAMRFGVSQS